MTRPKQHVAAILFGCRTPMTDAPKLEWRERWWKPLNHPHLRIKDIENLHLINIIKFIERGDSRYDQSSQVLKDLLREYEYRGLTDLDRPKGEAELVFSAAPVMTFGSAVLCLKCFKLKKNDACVCRSPGSGIADQKDPS